MTSWSVVRSISAIRSTSTRARVLERGERVGRDEPAAGLRAGDRELDPEHRLEARLRRTRSRPSRRACSGGSSDRPGERRVAAASSRRCRGGAAGRPSGSRPRPVPPGRARRVRSGPRPTTASTRPPAVRTRAVGVDGGAGVEDQRAGRAPPSSRPVDRVAAARRVRVAGRGEDDRDRRARERPGAARPRARAAGDAPRQVAARRGQQQRPERHGQPRQDRLRLGIAEAGVALEEDRVRRRSASGRRRARRGTGSRAGPARRGSGGGTPRRAPGSRRRAGPASGLYAPMPPVFGPRSPSASRLWSRDERQGQRLAAVAQGDEARLAAVRAAPRPRPGRPARPATAGDRRLGLGEVVADRHALAGGQAVGLDDDAARRRRRASRAKASAGSASVERGRPRHPDAGRGRDLVAERLAALDPGRGRASGRRPRSRRRRARRRRRPPAAPRAR